MPRTLENLLDPFEARRRRPLVSHRVGIGIGYGFLIRRRNEARCRVVAVRQLRVWYESRPLVFPGPGHRQQAIEVRAQRRKPGGMLTDVAVAIGVNDVFRRHLPAWHGTLELLPVARTIEAEGAEVPSSSRLCSRPAQRQRAPAVFPHHRTVSREMQNCWYLRRSADTDGLELLPHRLPAVLGPVLLRVCRVQCLKIQILLVYSENGKAPCNVLIVSR